MAYIFVQFGYGADSRVRGWFTCRDTLQFDRPSLRSRVGAAVGEAGAGDQHGAEQVVADSGELRPAGTHAHACVDTVFIRSWY